MTVKEAYEEWFIKPVQDYIKSSPQELIDYLEQHQQLHLSERFFDYSAVHKRLEDPTYLQTPVEMTEQGLIFNDINQDVIDFVINHLSKDITELELTNKFFEDISFLSQFPKLCKLRITGMCKFSDEEITFIKEHTNITEIETTNGTIVKNDYQPKEGEVLLTSPTPVFISGNLTNRAINNYFIGDSIEAKVSGKTIDFALLERAFLASEHSSDKPIISVEVKSTALKDEHTNRQTLMKLFIGPDQEITKMIYNGREDVASLTAVTRQLERKRPIKKILLNCENKTYDNMYYLNSIAKNHDLSINYGELSDCTLEEFVGMRETIDWFNELVRQYNLSPAEIVTYAYDIMKTFAYKENEEDRSIPRNLHSIVATDYIACVGYSKFLTQILTENHIAATEAGVTCNVGTKDQGGHSKTLVRIDDDKYDIHGVYCVDATWDRDKGSAMLVETKDGKNYVQYATNEGDTVQRQFDSMGLYRNYLVPAKDYLKIYPTDTEPQLYKATTNGVVSKLVNPSKELENEYSLAITQMQELFGKNPDKDLVADYMVAKKPNLETLERILYNVRRAQGYTNDQALEIVEDNIALNQMIDEYNREEATFFQPSQKR